MTKYKVYYTKEFHKIIYADSPHDAEIKFNTLDEAGEKEVSSVEEAKEKNGE